MAGYNERTVPFLILKPPQKYRTIVRTEVRHV